ncbi:protein lethal(2)essential for life-like [Coccinella septempunctata]|uniref:protein lethal(2)essential for life-like n=1 Tax=Coccinella septempunctata TaxID=41139 RepID=UPI001D07527A|nr:protein lethal(2)essential for life-like [Coccinella septempunctata]
MPKKKFSVEKIRPIHIPDSQFGILYDPEELIRKIRLCEPDPSHNPELPHGYIRPWKDPDVKDAGSTVSMDEEKYEAILDVKQFSPEELTVSIDGVHVVSVEGDQKDKKDHGALVDRYFKRTFYVPPVFDCEKVQCTLSSDGIIIITIPRLEPVEYDEKKVIPIVQTGESIRDEVIKRVEAIKKENL